MIRTTGVIASLVLSAAALTGCGGVDDQDIEFASLSDVKSLRESLAKDPKAGLIIDARAAKYYTAGHIPGATNYQLPDFDDKATQRPSIEAYDELVVYGDNPGSPEAKGLAKRLMHIGYSGVLMYAGGLEEWKDAGMPIEKGRDSLPAPER